MARKSALVSIVALFVVAESFSQSLSPPENFASSRRHQVALLASSSALEASAATFEPVFDFQQNDTVESFERIDDAIMGGISTSALRDVPGKPYASWSGVCRIDGG